LRCELSIFENTDTPFVAASVEIWDYKRADMITVSFAAMQKSPPDIVEKPLGGDRMR